MIKQLDRCKYNDCNKKSTTTLIVKGYPTRILKVCQEHRNEAYKNKGA